MAETKRLVGSDPNQLPRNKDLGRLAFTDTAVVPAPASASSVGRQGDIAHDADYLYVCVAQNTWKRVAIATW